LLWRTVGVDLDTGARGEHRDILLLKHREHTDDKAPVGLNAYSGSPWTAEVDVSKLVHR
jgi:hypothetical protein